MNEALCSILSTTKKIGIRLGSRMDGDGSDKFEGMNRKAEGERVLLLEGTT
jgi:hypothetical protein